MIRFYWPFYRWWMRRKHGRTWPMQTRPIPPRDVDRARVYLESLRRGHWETFEWDYAGRPKSKRWVAGTGEEQT
jgi:hypothetical protein